MSISKQKRCIKWNLVRLEFDFSVKHSILRSAPDLRMLCHYSSIQSLPAFLFPHGVKEKAVFFLQLLYLRKSFENIPALQGLVRTPVLLKQKLHSVMMKLNKLTVALYKTGCWRAKVPPRVFHLYALWNVYWRWRQLHSCWAHKAVLVS